MMPLNKMDWWSYTDLESEEKMAIVRDWLIASEPKPILVTDGANAGVLGGSKSAKADVVASYARRGTAKSDALLRLSSSRRRPSATAVAAGRFTTGLLRTAAAVRKQQQDENRARMSVPNLPTAHSPRSQLQQQQQQQQQQQHVYSQTTRHTTPASTPRWLLASTAKSRQQQPQQQQSAALRPLGIQQRSRSLEALQSLTADGRGGLHKLDHRHVAWGSTSNLLTTRSGSSLDTINLSQHFSPSRRQPSSSVLGSSAGGHGQRSHYERVASPKPLHGSTLHGPREGPFLRQSCQEQVSQQRKHQLTTDFARSDVPASIDPASETADLLTLAITVPQSERTEIEAKVPSMLHQLEEPHEQQLLASKTDARQVGEIGQRQTNVLKEYLAEDDIDGLTPSAPKAMTSSAVKGPGKIAQPQVVNSAQWQPPQPPLPLQPLQQQQQQQQPQLQQHRSWVAVTSTRSGELSSSNSTGTLGTADHEGALHSAQREPQTAVGYFTERERLSAAAAVGAAGAPNGRRPWNNNTHRHLQLEEEKDGEEGRASLQGQKYQESQLGPASNSSQQVFTRPPDSAGFIGIGLGSHNSRPHTGFTAGEQNPVRRVERRPVSYGYNWLQEFNKMSITEAEIEKRVKNGGKLRNSATQTTRFELPFDVRDLEGMDPKDYLRQYTVVSSRRMYLYQKVFQKYKNSTLNAVEIKDLPRCISDIIVGGISDDKLDEVMELACLKSAGTQLDAKLFYAVCAVVERQTTGKKLPDDPSEVMESHKQRLESADFIGLSYKFQGVNLPEKMARLLRAL